MPQTDKKEHPLKELLNVRPHLQVRVDKYDDKLSERMLHIINEINALSEQLAFDAEIQENVDARLNAVNYRKARQDIHKSETALLNAAKKICFRG